MSTPSFFAFCNTVKRAQEIYSELLNIGQGELNINLLHAKFLKMDRADKEEKIKEFGKTEYQGDGIWIATSIVEASLDIDFDFLFTELLDLNSFFQRLGRVNRKGEKNIDKTNAYLFTEINTRLFINENETRGFIDKKIYDLSKEAVLEIDGVLKEEEKVNLIEKYLTSENLKGSKFTKNYEKIKRYINDLYIAEKKEKDVKRIFRNISSCKIIPISIYKDNLDTINHLVEIIKTKFKYKINISREENKNEKTKLKISQEKAKNKLDSYTVNVGFYDLNGKEYLDLGYEKIRLVNCEYSYQLGFIRIPIIKEKETFDGFI